MTLLEALEDIIDASGAAPWIEAVLPVGVRAREEIDQWIEANEQQAAEAHAAWSAGQDAIRP